MSAHRFMGKTCVLSAGLDWDRDRDVRVESEDITCLWWDYKMQRCKPI